MAVAVTIGLVFYPGSPTMQARVSKRARENVLACCRGLSPLAAKPCEAVPWPFLLLLSNGVIRSVLSSVRNYSR